MPDVRVQVAFHFTFDPAKQLAEIPTEITKTLAVGDVLVPEKVASAIFAGPTKAKILDEMSKLVVKHQKKAKPAAKKEPETKAATETGAQGSLL